MLTRDQLLDFFRYESRLLAFLGRKAQPEHLSFRPTPGQRSLLELMEYVASTGITSAMALVNGNWDHAKECQDRASGISSGEEFAQRVEAQEDKLIELIEGLSEEELATREVALPWGDKMTLGAALIAMPHTFMTAYRMQLFLYLKQAGLSHLTTYEAWAGVDKPAEEPKKATT